MRGTMQENDHSNEPNHCLQATRDHAQVFVLALLARVAEAKR